MVDEMEGKTAGAFHVTEQGLTNCGPRPVAGFVNKFYWDTAIHLFIHCLWLLLCSTQQKKRQLFVGANL